MLGSKLPRPVPPDVPQAAARPATADAQPAQPAAPVTPETTPIIPPDQPAETTAPPQPAPVEPTEQQPEREPESHESAAEPTEAPVQSEIPVTSDDSETPVSPAPTVPDWTDRFDGLDGRLADADARLDAFDARFEALDKRLDGLRESLDGLSGSFSKRSQYDEAKEKVIDRQHAELNKLRDGLTLDLREPVLQDIASALAKINTMKGELPEDDTEARNMLEDIDYMLGAILDDYDVARVDSEPGSRYNAARQRFLPKDVEPTDDPAKARTIARSKAPGYVYEAGERPRVLLKEQVVMYRVVKPASPAETPDGPADAPAAPETPDAPSSIG
ncbi:hypothetical protein [Bifidobacterium parmae]|uniref:Molecular chaperone GrpE (Heat shock protein)-like protein n=1 Tax=Bifidobacterium parmae TaxID=361854 RepID=A0A2N5IVS4_9BIFI|nr:hypothetical protein [Bifidobacterium parmae]PLS26065.1 Molecular chaperone GrpE (heat shock protein)-like protein [Bifidobacterium parmae]